MNEYNDFKKPLKSRIAVLRANAIGDFVFSLPALEALRGAYPHAEIVLLGLAWHAAFLDGRPSPVDRVEIVPRCRGVGEAEDYPIATDHPSLEPFFARMRQQRFNLAIQMHGGGRHSNPFVQRLGARRTVGLRAPGAAALDDWLPYVYFQPEIVRCLEVAALAGAASGPLEPRLAPTAADAAAADAVLSPDGAPVIVLHPGAGDPRRRWPPSRFAALADALAARGYRIAINGIDSERAMTAAVAGAMHRPAADLAGRLSLPALTGLLARAALVVGNDSGPLHLAGAVGAATVGIYWCGNLMTAGTPLRGRHRPVVSWRLQCPECGRSCIDAPCEHRVSFVADVPVEEVLTASLALLEQVRVARPVPWARFTAGEWLEANEERAS